MNVSINKGLSLYSYWSHYSSYISSESWEEKKPEDNQLFLAVHIINNICDTDPLDN